MPLNRLLYSSRSLAASNGLQGDAEIRELTAFSAARNAATQLTGILLYVDGTFIQVLEGPMGSVERTFEAICCDFRHEDVKLIDLVPVKERIFPEWSMTMLGAGKRAEHVNVVDLQEVRYLANVNAREAIAQMRRLLDKRAA